MVTALALDKNETTLLDLVTSHQLPSYRQAYSDRTAWQMACLSELAYQSFSGLDQDRTKRLLQDKLDDLLAHKRQDQLAELIDAVSTVDAPHTQGLINSLADHEMQVESCFDYKGTQALLISSKTYLALVFRGTEATSFQDIKTDMKARKTQCPSKGGIHSGFHEAYELIATQIQQELNQPQYAKKPLFIAGHSLGGALATIAAKRLEHQGGIAACYSYGSPRVGDEEWSHGIKTPIFRLVNAIDCVTMLPPGGMFIKMVKFLLSFIPFFGTVIAQFLSAFEGYHHVGDMRYLTNCKPEIYDDVHLLTHVSLLRRLRIISRGKMAKHFIKDHSIAIYRKKLAVIALRHNQT